MKRTLRLTERDLSRIVRRVIKEQNEMLNDPCQEEIDELSKLIGGDKIPPSCLSSDMEDECIKEFFDMVGPFSYPGESIKFLRAITNLLECRKANPDYDDSEDVWGEQGV